MDTELISNLRIKALCTNEENRGQRCIQESKADIDKEKWQNMNREYRKWKIISKKREMRNIYGQAKKGK